jgi:hypothetical protein
MASAFYALYFVRLTHETLLRMDKARKMGWHGYADTLEVVMETFERFAELKMIPTVPFLSRADERSIHLG